MARTGHRRKKRKKTCQRVKVNERKHLPTKKKISMWMMSGNNQIA